MNRTVLSLAATLLALALLVGFRDLPQPALIHAHGSEIKYKYTIIPAIACRLPPAAAEANCKEPEGGTPRA
ncbi:MAG: hypothetical protein RQ758_01290 [Methanomicrobiaceae archaeon]|nr:hypothetical protein [Methanomicrobiaceae archaeon]